MPLIVVATLTILPDKVEAFNAYERKALSIIRAYGGRLIDAIRMDEADDGNAVETHILEFPDATAFEAYRASPQGLALREERDNCIVKTAVQFGARNAALSQAGLAKN